MGAISTGWVVQCDPNSRDSRSAYDRSHVKGDLISARGVGVVAEYAPIFGVWADLLHGLSDGFPYAELL
jgi:hypothetical protein